MVIYREFAVGGLSLNQNVLQGESAIPPNINSGLREWIDTLAPLFHHNPTPMCLTDNAACVVYGNQAFRSQILTTTTKLHRPLAEHFPKARRLATHLEKLITQGESGLLYKPICINKRQGIDTFQVRVEPLRDKSSGKLAGSLITFTADKDWYQREFTEEKQTLTARIHQLSQDIIEKKSLLKTLMDYSPFGMALFDRQKQVMHINDAAATMLGIDRRHATGTHCSRLFNCFDDAYGCPVIDGQFTIHQHETSCPRADKNTFLRSAVLCRERDEEIVLEAFIDITEIKRAQAVKEEAYQAKNDFFAKMSHELRTPLNAIIGFSEMIAMETDSINKEDLEHFSHSIQHAGYDLLHLVDQVLDISKLESNKVANNPVHILLQPLLEEITTTIEPMVAKNHNHLTVELPNNMGNITADPDHLKHILLNLLSNACKFTTHGNIVLKIDRVHHASESWLQFQVMDSGIGLAEDQIRRIFDAFEQADNSTTRQYGGSGLGLSIAKQLSEVMGGRIDVKSQPGQGSTFTLWLPNSRSGD